MSRQAIVAVTGGLRGLIALAYAKLHYEKVLALFSAAEREAGLAIAARLSPNSYRFISGAEEELMSAAAEACKALGAHALVHGLEGPGPVTGEQVNTPESPTRAKIEAPLARIPDTDLAAYAATLPDMAEHVGALAEHLKLADLPLQRPTLEAADKTPLAQPAPELEADSLQDAEAIPAAAAEAESPPAEAAP